MRKRIRNIKSDIRGSVSLFFIIITAVIFAFNAILIDYARILAAKQQTEYAIQTAARSTLANFDNTLVEKYGLFGMKDSSLSTFETVLKKNLEASELDDDAFNFVNINVEDVSGDLSRDLANVDLFKHQVLEDMKYKAPIEIIEEVVEKILKSSKAVKEASVFIDIASEISDLFDEREELLKEVFNLVDETEEELKTLHNEFTKNGSSDFVDIKYFTDIPKKFNDYEDLLEKLDDVEVDLEESEREEKILNTLMEAGELPEDIIENQILELEIEIENLKKREQTQAVKDEIEELEEKIKDKEELLESQDILKEVRDKLNEYRELHKKWTEAKANFEKKAEEKSKGLKEKVKKVNQNMASIYEKIEEVEKLNNDMKKVIDDGETSKDSMYSDAIGSSNSMGSGGELDGADEIAEETMKLKDYIYDQSIFTDIKETLKTDYNEILDDSEDKLKELEDAFKSKKLEKMAEYKDNFYLNELKSSIEKIKPRIETVKDPHIKKIKDHQNEYFRSADLTPDQQEEKEKEAKDEAKEENEKMKDQNEEIKDKALSLAEDAPKYAELALSIEKIELHTELQDAKRDGEMEIGDDYEDSAKNSMGVVDMLFSGLGSAFVGARDRLYVNEYILSRYESKTPKNIAKVDDYLLKNREVEYIMYGQHIPGSNYTLALGEITGLRLILNFIAAFKDHKVRLAPHPLAKFIMATGIAITYTVDDMGRISTGKSVAFIRNVTKNIELNYEDYLRIFLFINPSGEARYTRMMALIDHNGKDLTELQTYVSGTVETSVDLLFFPQASSILGRTGVIDGQVDGTKFKMNYEAEFSY